MRDPAENAQLALLLEVTGTPKPGNVDRHRDYPGLRFEHFAEAPSGRFRVCGWPPTAPPSERPSSAPSTA